MDRGGFLLLLIGAGLLAYAGSEASAAINSNRELWPGADPAAPDPDFSGGWPEYYYDNARVDVAPVVADYFDMSSNFKRNEYPKYAAAIEAAEVGQGIPHDLLAALLFRESSYLPEIIDGRRKSSAGALGIGQFMPATAAEMRINPLDPAEAIPGAAKYLRQMFNIFGNWRDALGAYNAGPGNYRRILAGTQKMTQQTAEYIAAITGNVAV